MQLDSTVRVAGFADRNAALGDLKYNTDGSVNSANYWSITFIMLLFIFFECLPVFVKLMSSRDAYDAATHDTQSVDIHRSAEDRDVEVEILNTIHDTRVQKGVEKWNEQDRKSTRLNSSH